MKMTIEVYQRRGGNVHVVLQGENIGDTSTDDPDVFARYIETWRAFTATQTPRPAVRDRASAAVSRPRRAPAFSR